MAETSNLLTIGEFSRRSRLSVRMLRHYDATGVLVPAHVDPCTGHRRYAPEQLGDAADVRTLRDVGFGVAAIAALLPARRTPAWTSALELQRETLTRELADARGRLALIDHLLDPGAPMSITVDRRHIDPMTVVTLRGTVPTYSDEGLLWQRLWPLLGAQCLTPTGPGGVIEHDAEYTEHDPDLSIFLPVAPGATTEAPLEVLDLPARDAVVATVRGPYTQISAAHDAIEEFVHAEGLTLPDAGAPDATAAVKAFNVYLTTPDKAAPEDLVTEVVQPLA